ncbi:MAG: hypothetical protein ACPGLY_27590, partial [Rubripirellula sp.]
VPPWALLLFSESVRRSQQIGRLSVLFVTCSTGSSPRRSFCVGLFVPVQHLLSGTALAAGLWCKG